MVFDIRAIDLGKLNSMTKYPSILTYHVLADKGMLQEAVQIPFTGPVIGTEKVDGTNTRILFCPDGSAILGSREDLLWERRDLIGNPAMGIVDALRMTVQTLAPVLCQPDRIVAYFVEVFGRNIGAAAKNYTKQGNVGFRLFDVIVIENFEELFEWPTARIAQWRDQGQQPFVEASRITELAQAVGFETVPALFKCDATELPTTLAATQQFLLQFAKSGCQLDEGALGVPEGVVVRSADRKQIAKIRREDYQRTLHKRPGR